MDVALRFNKYWIILLTRIKEDLTYRTNYVAGALLRFLPMITTIFLWRAVYGNGDTLHGGMDFRDVVAYYLLVYVSRGFSSMPNMTREISVDIKDGQLNKYLVKPLGYFGYQIVYRLAHKVVFWGVACLTFPPVFWLLRSYFTHSPSLLEWVAFAVLLAVAFLIGVLFSFLIGMLAFWFLEISTFLFVIMTIEYFLSGHLIPLHFLPGGWGIVVQYLPFGYEAYWPCMVILGKVPSGELTTVVGIGFVWVGVLYGLCRFLWARGMKRYSAVGG
jgi:ABC-2 type transport system permease protein